MEDTMPTPDKFFVPPEADTAEPIAITIQETKRRTGESRSKIYQLLGDGTYEGVKSGRRVLIIYESVKRRFAGLPRAVIKAPKPRPQRQFPQAPRRGRRPKPARTSIIA
jgi:excisionase family DNA binding protein